MGMGRGRSSGRVEVAVRGRGKHWGRRLVFA